MRGGGHREEGGEGRRGDVVKGGSGGTLRESGTRSQLGLYVGA